ncbi:hypothetical protein PM10SUCC1_14820 [Propionigenium maris DSM 9537]|uniref:Uncharacterized protein n=1 Tax=Propionigenium maris DSM 9537 TaxID=1123000 RepID=A0A9W6LMX7_9FUSO|nr:hypothetical protein PM10SUCC1_14820 [Propionigenium maris DSM 9537]
MVGADRGKVEPPIPPGGDFTELIKVIKEQTEIIKSIAVSEALLWDREYQQSLETFNKMSDLYDQSLNYYFLDTDGVFELLGD